MYASCPMSSASLMAVAAFLPDAQQGVELRCYDPRSKRISLASISSDRFPETVRGDLATQLTRIYSQTPPPTPDEFRRAAVEISSLLERCCVIVPEPFTPAGVTLSESTAWDRREALRTLIQATRAVCLDEITRETLLYPARVESSPLLLDIKQEPPFARSSSLDDAARHLPASHISTPVGREGEIPRTASPAQGSSEQDSRKPHPLHNAPLTTENREMRQAQELYQLTLLANTLSPWKIYAVTPCALIAPITNLASLILSTNVPLCNDPAFLGYMDSIRALDCCTASLAIAAVFTSFLSRVAFLPRHRLPVYKCDNPSRMELELANTTAIETTHANTKTFYPDCLLSTSTQQVRKNMRELAKQAAIEWELCEQIRRAQGLPPAQSSCIQKTLLDGARVVSLPNICGMILMATSAGLLAWIRASHDIAEQICRANTTTNTTIPPHDAGKDLTNYTIAPFITTFIGCVLLCMDAYRKHAQRQAYLMDRVPETLKTDAS